MTTPEVQIRDAVAEGYIEEHRAQTAADIAARLGWQESQVRRVFADSNGRVPGVDSARVPERLAPLSGHSPEETLHFPNIRTLAAKIRTLRGQGGTVHSLAAARKARQAGSKPMSLPRFTHAELLELWRVVELYLGMNGQRSSGMASPPDAAVSALHKLSDYATSLQADLAR